MGKGREGLRKGGLTDLWSLCWATYGCGLVIPGKWVEWTGLSFLFLILKIITLGARG